MSGPKKGKTCRCATDDDVRECVKSYAPRYEYDFFLYNCIDWALEAASSCCLDADEFSLGEIGELK